jgi:pimeloyl-ACP methyl ester carboxylesterase
VEGPRAVPLPDGRRLDVWVAGEQGATPLVFHPGAPSSGLPYPPMVEEVTKRDFRYVSWSRPGYGDSTRQPGRSVANAADDTATILEWLGAGDCFVLGWSGGGPHALACAALLPDRVRATATIGGVAPYPAEGLDWMAGMGAENIDEFTAAFAGPEALDELLRSQWMGLAQISGPEVATALGDLVGDVDRQTATGDYAEWLAAVFRDALRNGPAGWMDDDLAFAKPWGFELSAIQQPVHVWQGGEDRMVPYAHGVWLCEHLGTACRHLHPAEGHLSLTVGAIGQILDELTA